MMDNAWIYCRTASPDGEALAVQKDCMTAYAKGRGFEVVGVTAECASGLDFSRKGILEVTDAAERSLFSILLVKDLTRLGRSQPDVMAFVKRMKERRIEIVFLDGSTLDDSYMDTLLSWFAG